MSDDCSDSARIRSLQDRIASLEERIRNNNLLLRRDELVTKIGSYVSSLDRAVWEDWRMGMMITPYMERELGLESGDITFLSEQDGFNGCRELAWLLQHHTPGVTPRKMTRLTFLIKGTDKSCAVEIPADYVIFEWRFLDVLTARLNIDTQRRHIVSFRYRGRKYKVADFSGANGHHFHLGAHDDGHGVFTLSVKVIGDCVIL